MNGAALHARLVNAEGELLAEGACWLNEPQAQATLEPERAPSFAVQKGRGPLTLELESGRTLKVSDRLMVVRIAPPGSNGNGRRSLYRLRLLDTAQDVLQGRTAGAADYQAQDAEAAGGGEGTPTLRFGEETPAAR